MGGGRESHEQGVPKKRPLMVPDRRGPSGEGRGGGTAEPTSARPRPPREQCPEEVTVVLPPTETFPVGSQVSLTPDGHSPSGVALVYGNRLIPLRAESVSGAVRGCVSQGVRYVGTIERYGTDPTSLAAFLRKE
jgi:hypothetical protein